MVKRSLSAIASKLMDPADLVPADKPKVLAGIDTDGSVFQITLPLMVRECDITTGDGKKTDGTTYDKANVCYKFAAKGLVLGVKMDDGSVRYYNIKNNAGIYGPDRYLSFSFDPSVFFTRPVEVETDTDTVVEHVPPMESEAEAA